MMSSALAVPQTSASARMRVERCMGKLYLRRARRSGGYNSHSCQSTSYGFSMLAKLEQSAALLTENELKRAKHALIVLPKTASVESLRAVPGAKSLSAALARRKKKLADLAKSPLAVEVEPGVLSSWIM